MLQLQGAPALSAFRLAKLVTRLAALEPAVKGLDARFVHFIDLAAPLSAAQRTILERLLTYGPHLEPVSSPLSGDTLLVVPRSGTISAWSSKATDIAHVCGLTQIRRIERGIKYRVLDSRPLGPEELAALAPVLLDRMTEMVLFDPQHAQRLFDHSPPRPLSRIAL